MTVQFVVAQQYEPVNKNASTETQELLNYLYSISGKKTLSGQHNYGHEITRSTDSIIAFTGKTPAIWGSDFIHRDFEVDIDLNNTVEQAILQHKQGAIITLMYHQGRPYADSIGHFRDKFTNEEWKQLVTPGTAIHQTWLHDIDKVAGYLTKLQKQKIPVLWRPYHEMNGGWFWWGQRLGDNGYKKLWKMLYERYTNHHQLNNLIWVWNANAPIHGRKGPSMEYVDYFPGHEFVDVLAADIYRGDYRQSHHDQLVELANEKPIAMGEIGLVPEPQILDQQPRWTWFMIWARFPWTKNNKDDVRNLYNHPRVLLNKDIVFDDN